jgi:hypothetical protein
MFHPDAVVKYKEEKKGAGWAIELTMLEITGSLEIMMMVGLNVYQA